MRTERSTLFRPPSSDDWTCVHSPPTYPPNRKRKVPGWLTPARLTLLPGWCCWSCCPRPRCQRRCRRSWTGGCWRSWTRGSSRRRTGWSQGCSWGTGSETSAWRPGWCSSLSQRRVSGDWGESTTSPKTKQTQEWPWSSTLPALVTEEPAGSRSTVTPKQPATLYLPHVS